jgi:hypothetical protein
MMLNTPFEDREFARAMGAKGAAERERRRRNRISAPTQSLSDLLPDAHAEAYALEYKNRPANRSSGVHHHG